MWMCVRVNTKGVRDLEGTEFKLKVFKCKSRKQLRVRLFVKLGITTEIGNETERRRECERLANAHMDSKDLHFTLTGDWQKC